MERLTPLDVEKIELTPRFRGYDRDEVQRLIKSVADEMQALRSELSDARNQVERQQGELDGYRAQEDTLKQALILAQRTADETRASAHKEAALIQEAARQKTSDAQRDAETKLNDLRWDLEKLRLEKQKFVNSFRSLLESHLRDLAEQGNLSVIEGDASQAEEAGA